MEEIKDFKLKEKNSAAELVRQLGDSGFQASELGKAVELMERMKKESHTVFLGCTANLIASGLRGVVAELCREKFVNAVITTAGAIEHDFIKSFQPYFQGEFDVNDSELHEKGINRIGNIFVPNERYELFEKEFQKLLKELKEKSATVNARAIAQTLGEKVEDEQSFLFWAAKNKIPVFCPGIMDGAIGLQTYFFKQENQDFVVDATADLKELADMVLNAEKTSGIILGGGIAKHYLIGANILREGLDLAVYISTAQEFDGSLSGARTKEAKSWGKIKEKASTAHVCGDATIVFPLIVAALKEKRLI